MFAKPSFATAIELKASGIEVPAAKTVVPMTTGGIFKMQPILVHQSTIKCVMNPIKTMDMRNDIGYHVFHFSFWQFGMQNAKTQYQGMDNKYIGICFLFYGSAKDSSSSSLASSMESTDATFVERSPVEDNPFFSRIFRTCSTKSASDRILRIALFEI